MTYLTPAEVAEKLKVSQDTVRRIFRHYPGVQPIATSPNALRVTLRIPEDVLERYLRERQVA